MREDWVKATIDDLIHETGLFKDGDWVESKDQDQNGEVRLIQLADIGDGTFLNKSDRYLTKIKSQELKCTFLKEGDILVARMPYPLGRATLFPLKGEEKHVTVVDVAIIRLNNVFVIPKYLLYIINSPVSRKAIEQLQSGTTRKRISRKNLSTIQFPIAPLPEQRAIVAKIEELFSELDNGVANLNKAKEKLEIYRQAVLKKAFEGELTKEWREGRNDLKTGEETLTKIKNYRDANYESQIDVWKDLLKDWDNEGKIGMKPKKPSKLDVSAFDDYAVDQYTPKDWIKCQLADVLYGLTDYHANGSYEILKENVTLSDQEDYSVMIRATNFEKNDFSKDMKYIDEHAYNFLSKTKLHGGEILIGKIGNAGKVYLMPNLKRKASLAMNLFALIVDQKNILSKFLYYQLKNFYQEKEISSYVKGVGNPTIDKISIRSIHINLCSVEEQIRIVQEIEARLSLCDNIDICIKQGLNKANALRQSILKQAFEGKLLSEAELEKCKNESDWEPAEILLEKINNELRSAK